MLAADLQSLSTPIVVRSVAAAAILWFVVPRLWQILCNAASPIVRIPGPLSHKLSEWPLVLSITKGRSHEKMQTLHKQYGPIVALAPGMIAVSEPQAIRQILLTQDWPKSNAIYANFRQDPDRPTLLAFTDKKAYGVRKRLVSSMFGIRYIRGMEPIMRDCVRVALNQLHASCQKNNGSAVVDIHRLMRALAVDIIGATTFGESFHVVEQGSHPLPKKIEYSLLLSGIFQFLPWLKGMPGFPTRDPYINEFTGGIVDRRRQTIQRKEIPRHDLLQKLVETVDDSPQSPFRTCDLQDEVVVLLTAGSETTATAEIFTTMLLAKNPDKLAKLHEEIDRVYPDAEEETTAEKMNQMPYLQACFDETMRLYAAMASGSPREAPEDTTLLGYHIPKGTTVFPTTATLHRDGSLWSQPNDFVPERWLESSGEAGAGVKKAGMPFYPFSAGSRVCIGQHFALQEMYLSIVSLLRNFTLEYIPGQDESTVFRVALQLSAGTYKVGIRERNRK
ncbi:cytochrome P450 [Aspergillus filifer]